MARVVLTDFDVLEIARRAVERRRRRVEEFCARFSEEYIRQYLPRCLEVDGLKRFFKSDFMVAARQYCKETGYCFKIETLLRRFRDLARHERGIRYVDKQKGLYEIIKENTQDEGVL